MGSRLFLDDVRTALGETDPNSTNSGALRQELAAPALEALGAAPDVPKELVQAVWSAAWTAAQARTAGAQAQAQALVAQQAQELAVARDDALAGQQEADDAAQALVAAQALAVQQADEAAQALAQQQQAQAALRQELAAVQQAQALELARGQAVEATLRAALGSSKGM